MKKGRQLRVKLNIWIDPKIRKRFDRAAKKNGETMSSVIRGFINEYNKVPKK